MWQVPAGLLRRRQKECWAAVVGLLLLTLTLFAAGVFEPVENRLAEARAQLLDRAPTGEVTIVEIDAKSLAALNNWPWPRRYHAELIQRLGAARVSMLAFDVDFSARSNPADDRALANALATVHPVILPVFQQRASDSPNSRSMIKSRPAAPFRDAWIGGVNILPGRDGVVRDFPAATMINGQIQPAMAVLLSDNGALGDRTFVPDWSIDVQRIPRFSFIDVLQGRVPARDLAGKRVIVGATAIEIGDRYAIPRFGTVPGVIIQALAAESLIQHRAVMRSGLLPTIIGLLLIGLLLSGRFERFGRTFPLAAGGVLLLFLAVPIAVQSRWPVSIDTAPLLVAAVVAIALRLIVEARHRVRLAELRDAETALPNERALVSALEEAGDTWLCLTAASIERFEAIRSALASSDVADLVALAAARIERVVGSSVYRLAPDTLAWLAPTERDPEKDCVEISDSFARPVQVATTAIDTAWTYGLAATTRETSPTQLVERALAAVTDARARGRTRQWFQGVAADALRDLSLMGELRSGIDQDQLFVAYQPKLHLQSGRIAHAEALVRWRHPTEGLMPPDRFMPLAEATGVVREITRFVLRRTIAECLDPKSSSSPIAVSVNVSAADIGQPDFANEVILTLADARVDPARLTLEITESAIIRSKDTALRVLDELRDHGIRLSIDDYGTGQSTLSYLKTLPVSELKIDKMFVTRLCENESDRIMVRSTIDLAHQLGLTVVAEGAEDWDTVMLLTEFGCDYAQGFVIGRAVSMQELRSLADTEFKRAA
jgi:EAL domain-containing protein (putative c-di-GMP-specific phosphodiesterase class I)/CHASE2 domain-containing sensor protein